MENVKKVQKTNQSFVDQMGVSYIVLKRGVLAVMMAVFLECILK